MDFHASSSFVREGGYKKNIFGQPSFHQKQSQFLVPRAYLRIPKWRKENQPANDICMKQRRRTGGTLELLDTTMLTPGRYEI